VSAEIQVASRQRPAAKARWTATIGPVQPPVDGNSWLGLTDQVLPLGAVYDWCVQPQCGAVVLFSGTVRDHAADDEGVMRNDVQYLTYEAYEDQVVPAFRAIERELRSRWPHTGRVAILHRVGRLELLESSVVAAISAPHRPEAFEAARYAIDALKASAPIWKHEVWADGADWGARSHPIEAPQSVPTSGGGGRS
jgi:molybdopterin synthase catalytic subunit